MRHNLSKLVKKWQITNRIMNVFKSKNKSRETEKFENEKHEDDDEERCRRLRYTIRFFCISISSLLLLLLIPSAAGTFSPGTKAAAARAINRGRRNKQSAEFLLAHNDARGASGASSLKWDKGLARFASNWAKQRKSDCKMTHSGGPYGENIFWYQRSENWSPKRVVAKWMEESLKYDRMTNTCKSGEMCGHYTQIIWRTTTAVGCIRARCDNNRGFLVICEYSPSGNYEGESPFDMPK